MGIKKQNVIARPDGAKQSPIARWGLLRAKIALAMTEQGFVFDGYAPIVAHCTRSRNTAAAVGYGSSSSIEAKIVPLMSVS